MHSPFRHIGSILWKRRPIQLTFFVTRRCNLHCPFCFYLSSTTAPAPPVEELSLDEIQRVSRSMGTLLWVAFSGGEVFLRDDLAEIARTFYRRNKPAIMLFPTNGHMPDRIRDCTERIPRDCPRSVIVVKLSLDGLDGDHDRLRDMPGSFAHTMKTYDLLGELLPRYPHFELGVNTVLCSENQDRIEKIIDFVRGLDRIRTHTVTLVRGHLLHERFKEVEIARYEEASRLLEDLLKRRASPIYRFPGGCLKAAQDILQRRLIRQTFLAQSRDYTCYAGRLNLVLSENGEVYPCETLTTSLGNVRDFGYDMNRLLRSARAGEVLRPIRERRCWCTHECYQITNIFFNPRRYPALLREYL
ncbi:MAG: radical SAM protein, partial [Nitrospirae bacterium]|nr:radical SAM protein [Nitrospirota bacterium]